MAKVIIRSGNDLSQIRRQAIIWTNANVPPIGTPGKTSGEILINTTFSDGQMHLKNVYANCPQIENDMSKSLRSNDANIRAVFQYEYVVFPGMGSPLKKIKPVVRLSYLCNVNPYTGKTTSLYWDSSDPYRHVQTAETTNNITMTS